MTANHTVERNRPQGVLVDSLYGFASAAVPNIKH